MVGGIVTDLFSFLFFTDQIQQFPFYVSGGDEPILSYEAVIQQECE